MPTAERLHVRRYLLLHRGEDALDQRGGKHRSLVHASLDARLRRGLVVREANGEGCQQPQNEEPST